jgi:hypothetical protein
MTESYSLSEVEAVLSQVLREEMDQMHCGSIPIVFFELVTKWWQMIQNVDVPILFRVAEPQSEVEFLSTAVAEGAHENLYDEGVFREAA